MNYSRNPSEVTLVDLTTYMLKVVEQAKKSPTPSLEKRKKKENSDWPESSGPRLKTQTQVTWLKSSGGLPEKTQGKKTKTKKGSLHSLLDEGTRKSQTLPEGNREDSYEALSPKQLSVERAKQQSPIDLSGSSSKD
nr:hypothetical protein [Tanacetum cinerariifolium]